MDFQFKKNAVLRALKEEELDTLFQVVTDEDNYVLLQANQNMKNGNCLISLSIEDRAFNTIHYCIGSLDNPGKKENILDLLNRLNDESLMIKYYLSNNSIMARVSYIATDENFDAREFVYLTVPGFKAIEENYPKIMRVLWA